MFSLYLKSFPSICLERSDKVVADKISQQDQSVHLYTDFIRDLRITEALHQHQIHIKLDIENKLMPD